MAKDKTSKKGKAAVGSTETGQPASRYVLYTQWLEEEKGVKMTPEQARVAVLSYKDFQRSDINRRNNALVKEANAAKVAERRAAREAQAQARAEKQAARDAKRQEREAAKAARAEKTAKKAAKAETAAQAATPKTKSTKKGAAKKKGKDGKSPF